MRVAIIGAGPIGLAAALGAVTRGHDVTVLERDTVGSGVRRWGPTRFFSPLAMNVPPGAAGVIELPPADAILTGPEFADRVLVPLAASAPLAGRIRERCAVRAIVRADTSRLDLVGHPIRAERPFRMLVATPAGEDELEADAILDASGVAQPIAMNVPGERAAAERVVRSLGELDDRRGELAGKRVLLLGHGHSAANALHVLGSLGARVTWAVRVPNSRPCVEVASDPLPERQRIVGEANALAAKPPAWLRVERRAHVRSIDGNTVRLSGDRTVETDYIVAMIGARPDPSIASELALDIAPATEGVGGIARKLANVTDCLAIPTLGARDLDSGEPNYSVVGSKAYGRARTFLLQSGYAQLATLLDLLKF